MARARKMNVALNRMADASIHRKEMSQLMLQKAVREGRVVTVKSACEFMGLTRVTILKYVDELHLCLLDEQKGCWLNDEAKS